MMKIKTLTIKNFMSIGNSTQAIDFDRKDLTLVLGENLDLGGDDAGARNGVGKTSIINALSYALFGQALTNIRKDNLVNKSNGKNMLVTIEFESNGTNYRIERGRKPNVMKYFVGDQEQDVKEDDSQGDSRETQKEIDKLIGMSHDMFKHVVALNTYTEPFLSLNANNQRVIIEQLLGITMLSERAEKLKEQVKLTKETITEEDFRIKAVQDANKKMQEQVESLKKRQRLWQIKNEEECKKIKDAIVDLEKINIEDEIKAHKDLADYYTSKSEHEKFAKFISDLEASIDKNTKTQSKLNKELSLLEEHKCYACGQKIHDNKHDDLKKSKQTSLDEINSQLEKDQKQLKEYNSSVKKLGKLPKKPSTFYTNLEEAYRHQHTLETLVKELESRLTETDPYAEQIDEMNKAATEEINYDLMNELNKLKDHQEFLLKLLTNKDSFIRKRIIDQNLNYLNARLSQYLDKMGLPHIVTFQNDLSVNITELGRELDFDNLSRGERCRLILSLSFSFRDVWESLYTPINLLFVDELIDNGLDTSGVENAIGTLKKMSREANKSVWLVSHRDELAGRVNNVLNVVKENGFTSFDTAVTVI